jgi:hypothetical protein
MRHVRLLFVFAITVGGFCAAAGTAAAASFSTSPAGSITAASLGRLSFTVLGGLATVRCSVTLRGSLHRERIAKVEGTLIGFITAVTVAHPCEGGEANVLAATLPWHIVFRTITGTLPENVTGIVHLLIGIGFLLEAAGANCLYGGNVEGRDAVTRTVAGTYSTGLVTSNANSIPLSEEALNLGFACPASGRFVGTFGLVPLQTIIRS